MKVKQKITAIIMTAILVGSNLLSLGNQVIASSPELEKQNSKTNHANVEFNSYFEGNVHEKTFTIENGGKMYISLKVKENGYLKNGIVDFSNANYEIDHDKLQQNEIIQKIENNKIEIKQINKNMGEQIIEIPIKTIKNETVSVDNFNKTCDINFTATYVDVNQKEKNIQKTIQNNVKWTTQTEVEINTELSKYIPYKNDQEYGVIVQTKVNSKVKENKLPVAKTELKIQAPQITIPQTEQTQNINQTIKPEEVKILANHTKATNGQETGLNFTQSNYQYNKETGEIIITVENTQNQEGKISWKQNVNDEYLITYIFKGEEIYNYANQQIKQIEQNSENSEQLGININTPIIANITVYNEQQNTIQGTNQPTYKLQKLVGTTTDFNITSENKISKGYIYTNYEKQSEKIETTYTLNYIAQINYAQIINFVQFELTNEKFVDTLEKEYETIVNKQNSTYSKNVKISQNIFTKMLGEEGKIQIQKTDETLLGEITKDSKKDEQNNYVLNIEEHKINELKIITTKPITEGRLEINVEKAFLTEQKYTKQQMEAFKKLKITTKANTNTQNVELTKQIELIEPTEKAQISINKKQLSTIVKNENVEITALLDTSNIYNALYKNPILEIYMPEAVETVNLKNITITPDDELKVKQTNITKKGNKQVIQILLEGTQTKYTLNSMIKGTSIVLKTDISIKQFTPNTNTKITMAYTNNNIYEIVNSKIVGASANTENQTVGETSLDIELVSPEGLVTANGISNYVENAEEIMNMNEETQTVTVQRGTSAKTTTISGKIINNYENSIGNIKVLGRTPFTGNKKIDTQEELGSNFDMKMTSGITITGVEKEKYTVYYSEIAEATNDINNKNNGWTTQMQDLSKVKSYLIIFNNYEMVQGTTIDFSYQTEIPANLDYDKASYNMYKIYYDNIQDIGTMSAEQISSIIGVITEAGAKVEVNLTSSVPEETTVKKGDKITYTITVKNVGTEDLNKMLLESSVPFGARLIEETESSVTTLNSSAFRKSIQKLKVGETLQYTYKVQVEQVELVDFCREGTHYENGSHKTDVVHEMSEYKKTITSKAEIYLFDYKETIYSQEVKNTVVLSPIELEIYNADEYNTASTKKKNIYMVQQGQTLEYIGTVKNSYSQTLNNVTVQMVIPQGLTYVQGQIIENEKETTNGVKYDKNTRTVSFNINNLESDATKEIKLSVKADELAENEYEKKLNTKFQTTLKQTNTTYSSREITINIVKTAVVISHTANIQEQYIYEGDTLIYKIEIKNVSNQILEDVKIEDSIPQELKCTGITYRTTSGTEDTYNIGKNNKISITSHIEAGETLIINITCTAKDLANNSQVNISNKANITTEEYGNFITNEINHIIKPLGEQGSNNEQIIPGTYKIGGQVWIDKNTDGIKQTEESKLQGVQVVILNSQTLQIVKDGITQAEKTVTTDQNGIYSLINIPNGEYIAIFIYDTQRYTPTQYNAKSSDQTNNSDATTSTIILNGKDTQVAIAQNIQIKDGNIYNIDLGLIENGIFDFKLDKYISKITLTTPTIGTKEYTYDNSQLEKIEILAKNAGKSSIVIEYTITVTNEGNTSGYVKKIVDYLPEDTTFHSELNTQWHLSETNGNIYNTSLENEKINPGETKEIKLILSKQIQEVDLGNIVSNTAEIYETYNEQGLIDIDSQEANLLEKEDDLSMANIILSVVTGKIVLYTGLTIGVLAILIIGIIGILKITKRKKL